MRVDRRALLLGTLLLDMGALAAPFPALAAGWDAAEDDLERLQRRNDGRLGVAALDTGSGRRIGHRQDERFALCSTFKLLAAAAVLARIDRGQERPDRRISYGPGDLLDNAPVTRAHVGEGGMALRDLCAAAIEASDNTAANLLLASLGGPGAVTAFARALGDSVTRLDRNELSLNDVAPGEIHDTTSPAAMVGNMQKILLGHVLSDASRQNLLSWMIAAKPGLNRIRKGLPAGWQAGDKAGTGPRGETNDVAILWPPGRAPILVACYFADSAEAHLADRERVLAEVGRIVATRL